MRIYFLNWLKRRGRYRAIYDRSGEHLYMERYYLLFKDRPRWFPFNITLHKVCMSDLPILHDHPWPYATIILKGGYTEHVPDGKYFRGPGHVRFRAAEDLHWLELKDNQPSWSLFFMGKRRRDWGFLNDGIWIESEEYLDQQQTQP